MANDTKAIQTDCDIRRKLSRAEKLGTCADTFNDAITLLIDFAAKDKEVVKNK